MTDKRERKAFTGRHAAMILVAFFGTVIGVNMVMASFALSTFGGTVVDNSYVASQHYNEWLARADAQDRLGRASLSGSVLVSTSRPCSLCEAAAAAAGVSRMIHGPALADAGPPAAR